MLPKAPAWWLVLLHLDDVTLAAVFAAFVVVLLASLWFLAWIVRSGRRTKRLVQLVTAWRPRE